MDWLFSKEAEQEYSDYAERWKAAAWKSLQPLYDRAEKEGLWFYMNVGFGDGLDDHLTYGDHWWPPGELRAMQENGELLFWSSAFEVGHPDERTKELLAEIQRLQDELQAWKEEVETRQRRQAPPENNEHRCQRTLARAALLAD